MQTREPGVCGSEGELGTPQSQWMGFFYAQNSSVLVLFSFFSPDPLLSPRLEPHLIKA